MTLNINAHKRKDWKKLNLAFPELRKNDANTFANASKRVALTPGVLAIFWPTAAKILQFEITSTCEELYVNGNKSIRVHK